MRENRKGEEKYMVKTVSLVNKVPEHQAEQKQNGVKSFWFMRSKKRERTKIERQTPKEFPLYHVSTLDLFSGILYLRFLSLPFLISFFNKLWRQFLPILWLLVKWSLAL